jgi:hypothetical protein
VQEFDVEDYDLKWHDFNALHFQKLMQKQKGHIEHFLAMKKKIIEI